ncbi:MAG: type II toxin-antitoxin system VapC family toxin [Gemmatimonadales bacterium]
MAESVLVDAGFLVALLSHRDAHHEWAAEQLPLLPLPWRTCDAVLSEAFHLLGKDGVGPLSALLRREGLGLGFDLGADLERVLRVMAKYADVRMSLADACLVRMTEILPEPLLATTDTDFRLYRRHGRQVIPCLMPS